MTLIKNLHIAFALISVAGFIARGAWLVRHWPQARPRWMRTLPHIGDTALFLTGLTMVVRYQMNPIEIPWLGAKLAGLMAYILLGFVAFRGVRGGRPCLACMAAAVLIFAYIATVALTKRPFWW